MEKRKSVCFIINPASGNQDPFFDQIETKFKNSFFDYQIAITKGSTDAFNFAKAVKDKVDLIVVYGGDGTVMQVARALFKSETPLAIIPGGTANIVAKEFKIPLDPIEALDIIKSGKWTFKKIDMGVVNDIPFLIRINLGIMADMVLEADRELKNSLGQLAYGVTTVKTIANASPIYIDMVIDGTIVSESAVSLTITNTGNIGWEGFTFLPGIDVADGKLDVVLLNEVSFFNLIKLTGTTLLQTDSEVLKHWSCKKMNLKTHEKFRCIIDDESYESDELQIEVIPAALKVLIPYVSKD